MNIEEKAKAYDEAVKKAREIAANPNRILQLDDFEELFPGISDESEDERIRKELIEFIKSLLCNDAFDRYKLGGWIDWLEKQKESNKDKLRKISTPADENWFEIQKQWEKEDEDERIRKEIISLVLKVMGQEKDNLSDDKYGAMLAWLEKQKEHQETCTKFLAKILKHSAEGFRNVLKKKGIDYIPHESFWTGTAGTFSKQECNEFYKWKGDMTMELVTEETPEYKKGFKDGLDAAKKEQKPSIFPPGLGEAHWNPIPSGKDVHKWNLPEDFEEAVYKVANFISPFDSQEELRKVSHRFAEQLLDIAKKDLQKPAWSEEEENKIESIKCLITTGRFADTSTIQTIWNILDDLRPGWKPTEEQMEALNYAIAEWDGGKRLEGLYSLRNDLKKL